MRRRLFFLLLTTIIAAAIGRSALATRLDSFTIDEAYHIAAGVSYNWLGLDMQRDQARLISRSFQGVVIIDGKFMDRRLWWNTDSVRAAQPVARFGNVFVYRGTFDMSGGAARNLYFAGIRKEYSREPDFKAAEELLNESVQADPSAFFVYTELGNLALRRGAREEALRAYASALNHAPEERSVRQPIEQQLRRVSTEDLSRVSALRNPQLD